MRYLNLVRAIVVSQHQLREHGTFFGFAWSFLHPLLLVLVLFFFFHARIGSGIPHYEIYLLIAMIHFTHFSNATSSAMTILHSARQLTCNAILPKDALVLGTALSQTLTLVVSMSICVALAWVFGAPRSWSVAWLPLVLGLHLLLVLWVSLALACVYVFVKDTFYLYQVALRVLFLVTPIFYAADLIGDGPARWLLVFNPLFWVIEFSRTLIIDGASVTTTRLVAFAVANAVCAWAAFRLFKRLEPSFAEYV